MNLSNLPTYVVLQIVINHKRQKNIKITGKMMKKIVLKTAMSQKKTMMAIYFIKRLGRKCLTIYTHLFMKGIKCRSLYYLILIKNLKIRVFLQHFIFYQLQNVLFTLFVINMINRSNLYILLLSKRRVKVHHSIMKKKKKK